MTTLKEMVKEMSKDLFYGYYITIINNPKSYKKITKMQMYQEVLNALREDPEIILDLCSAEEINILRTLLEKNITQKNYGYIEYSLLLNLRYNNFISLENNKYFIYEDVYNYVKMALNLYNQKEHDLQDFYCSVIIGLTRAYNTIKLDTFINLLTNYNIKITSESLVKSIHENKRLKQCVDVIEVNSIYYVACTEYFYCEDVLKRRSKDFAFTPYSLQAILSIGKYRLNLFDQHILNFLEFLELHMEPLYVIQVINDMLICAGLGDTSETNLKAISDNIAELYLEISKSIKFFPCWL